MYVGVRAGGGIGDEIEDPAGDPYEMYRIVFDITFFFFVIVILLAIIQGMFASYVKYEQGLISFSLPSCIYSLVVLYKEVCAFICKFNIYLASTMVCMRSCPHRKPKIHPGTDIGLPPFILFHKYCIIFTNWSQGLLLSKKDYDTLY